MATTMTLSIIIEELEGKLAFCRAAVGKGVLSAALRWKTTSVPKAMWMRRLR
ncbi:hypothetical protein Goshw_030432 [Gossypium schwendimanii]|uniref:Uncharacterized protein n=1 Tax=Gossypium schwendimanii TaxID=34291 RepID=A0A7J9LJ93_GOSSC|nr:hypothetical protein [Gossypium schwendimanii]